MKKINLLLLLLCMNHVEAAQITVNTDEFLLNNNSNCSINEAILSAITNLAIDQCVSGDGDDQIIFADSLFDASGRLIIDVEFPLLVTSESLDISVPDNKILWLRGNENNLLMSVNLNDQATFSMNNTHLSGGFSTEPGGALRFIGEETTINLNRINFFNNRSASHGGAIAFNRDETLTSDVSINISHGQFSENHSDGDGGAIHLAEHYSLNLSDSQFTDNVAVASGGGIATADNIAITTSTFDNNAANTDRGGALFISEARMITIDDSSFIGNQADGGGAIQMTSPRSLLIDIKNNLFLMNTAVQGGGAISGSNLTIVSSAEVDFTYNVFSHNSSDSVGGAVSIAQSNATINFAFNQFDSNVANTSGGALRLGKLISDVYYQLNGNVFTHNVAGEFGGAIDVSGSGGVGTFLTMTNNTLGFNQADVGGAFYNFQATAKLSFNTFVYNQAHTSGASIGGTTGANFEVAHNILAHSGLLSHCDINGDNTTSYGANIHTDNSCALTANSDQWVADPMLSGFYRSGNGLPGFVPLVGSPAIDTAASENCTTPDGTQLTDDQQQQERNQDGNGDDQARCDSGALEAPNDTDLLFSDQFG